MAFQLTLPSNYQTALMPKETEKAIRLIKEFFQTNLAFELDLIRVTAPLFVKSGTGINDHLNGIEKPVSFQIKEMDHTQVEIVQSLAKWKRLTLGELEFGNGEGIYTDMNAIRPDEVLDNMHSLYVDQWDWERVMAREDRNLDFLKRMVRKIYDVIRRTERYVAYQYPKITPILPDEITFIHSEELELQYPNLTPKEREYEACRKYGAVFIIGIGYNLSNGQPHDGRAPDYDDWSTPNQKVYRELNGDILGYYPVFDIAFEMSSMGIRVDETSLMEQLTIRGVPEQQNLYFHRKLLNQELPLSIGGGIGQSRLCMFFLRKAHLGEIQASIWPDEMIRQCRENGIFLL